MEDREFAILVKKSVDNMNFVLKEAKERNMKLHIDFNEEGSTISMYYRYLEQGDVLKIRDFYIPVPNIVLI